MACNGFFGPQGRRLRLPLMDERLNEKIEAFEYKGLKITNFEICLLYTSQSVIG